MTTLDQVAGVCHLMLLVDLLSEEGLHTLPELLVNERLVCARIPLASEPNLADVRAVGENRVQLAPSDLRRGWKGLDFLFQQSGSVSSVWLW